MTELENASIEERQDEISKRKILQEDSKEIKYNKLKEIKNGHCIIHWLSGGSSKALTGYYHNGEIWFCCSNWTGKKGEMDVTSLKEFALEIDYIEPL